MAPSPPAYDDNTCEYPLGSVENAALRSMFLLFESVGVSEHAALLSTSAHPSSGRIKRFMAKFSVRELFSEKNTRTVKHPYVWVTRGAKAVQKSGTEKRYRKAVQKDGICGLRVSVRISVPYFCAAVLCRSFVSPFGTAVELTHA